MIGIAAAVVSVYVVGVLARVAFSYYLFTAYRESLVAPNHEIEFLMREYPFVWSVIVGVFWPWYMGNWIHELRFVWKARGGGQ